MWDLWKQRACTANCLIKVVVVVVAFMLWGCPRALAAVDRAFDASCRVSAGPNRGTGVVMEITADEVLVLTAAHVVGEYRVVHCEFFRQGHLSAPLRGTVAARTLNEYCDAAIVSLPKASFGGRLPEAVPLAGAERRIRAGETVLSVGCAEGRWSTAWQGRVVADHGPHFHFIPPPAAGRSGSPILDADGAQIVGLIRGRTVDDQFGVAVSVASIHAALRGVTGGASNDGADACRIGGRLLPLRPVPPTQPQAPWPTAPGPAERAIADLGETNRRLDEIAELLRGGLPAGGEQAPARESAPADDGGSGHLEEVLQHALGDLKDLPERIETRLERVRDEGAEGLSGGIRAYLTDLAAERLGDPATGITAGKLLAAALGLSGPMAAAVTAAAWLVSRRLGRRLGTGQRRAFRLLDRRLARRINALRGRLDRLPSATAVPPVRPKT